MPLHPRGRRGSWRDADPAHKGGPRPKSVRGVVRAVTRRLLVLRLVEGALLSAGIAAGTMAAAYGSGLAAARVDAIAVALVTGVAGGLAWFLEQRLAEGQVVRRLDRLLRHGGALVTAWEIEGDPQFTAQPLAQLCVRRVLDRLRMREALRVLVPSVAPPVLVPLAGATLLGLALDAKRGAQETRFLPLDGLEQELDALSASALGAREAGRLADAELRELLVTQQGLDKLRLELGQDEPPPGADRRLEEFDRSLRDLRSDLAADPDLSLELDRMRSRLDALREALEHKQETGGGESRTDGSGDRAGAGQAPGPGSSDSGPAELAGDGPKGTMGEPTGADREPAAQLAPGMLDSGPVARVWWDPIDDPLVADWVEWLRTRDIESGAPRTSGRR